MLVDLQSVSAAWIADGSRGVAAVLGVAQDRASSTVSNLRRIHGHTMFPKRAKGRSRSQKTWRLVEAIRLIKEGHQDLALPFLEDVLLSMQERNATVKKNKQRLQIENHSRQG